MAENKAQNFHGDRDEVNFQCAINKDDHLGFVAEGGVIFEGFKCEQGSCTLQGICG